MFFVLANLTNNHIIMKTTYLLAFLFTVFLFSSCFKDPITKGVITVYDEDGNTVSGVQVKLSQENIPGLEQTFITSNQISDAAGQSEHILEAEAIMNIDAVLLATNSDTLSYGQSAIRFIYGKTVYKDVQLINY